jgi:basic membrane protein A
MRLLLVATLLGAGTMLGAVESGPLKIALICSGSITDGGWNQLAAESVRSLKTSMGAMVSVVQKITPDQAGDELRSFASDGYDLVISHGYDLLTATAEAATLPGKAHFAVSGADVAKPGMVSIDYDVSQASYQAGMLAAMLTHSRKLGFIGGEKITSVVVSYQGFLAGAHSVEARTTVAETYAGWDEPEKAKAQAEALFQQGVDATFQCVDAGSIGVFEAVKEHDAALGAGAPVAWVFGCCADQNANPQCGRWTAGSVVIRLDRSFSKLARSVQDGSWKAGLIHENLASCTCVLTCNPQLLASQVISAEMQRRIDQAGRDLITGTITVPKN